MKPPNLRGWWDFAIVSSLKRHFAVPIHFENDATAAALAEKWLGAAKETENFVYITISTGIGAGIYSHGRLITGATGNAGDVGHFVIDPAAGQCVCGQKGCWEYIASGTAIARQASPLLGRDVTSKEVFDLAAKGHVQMKALVDQVFHYIGIGCVTLINTFDPEILVIGGGVSQVGDPLFDCIRDYVSRHALNPTGRNTPVVPAAMLQDAGLIGAAALVHIPY
ncbi:N-acetylmannosamine kinase [compost metagenome]